MTSLFDGAAFVSASNDKKIIKIISTRRTDEYFFLEKKGGGHVRAIKCEINYRRSMRLQKVCRRLVFQS